MATGPRQITFIKTQQFFARLEAKEDKVWLVWGNPQRTEHNQTLIKDSMLRKIRNWLNWFLDNK